MTFSQSIKESKDNLKDFFIIAIEYLFINEALLANNFNSNDELIKKENVFTENNLKDILGKGLSNTQIQGINTLTSLDTSSLNTAIFSYTPSLKSKSKAPNSTLGVVIGEYEDIESKRNTIHTDEYGRVKVRINCFVSQEVIDNKIAYNREKQKEKERNLQRDNANALAKTQENYNTTNNNIDSNHSQTKAYSYPLLSLS